MKLVIGAFKGELPILDPTLLSDQNAQVARNLYLRRGTLKAERGYDSRSITTVINPKTLWRYPNGNGGAGFWFTWGTNVDVVKSPLANDEWDRIYWTGEGGYPRVAGIDKATTGSAPYPGGSWRLGVPAPTSAPACQPLVAAWALRAFLTPLSRQPMWSPSSPGTVKRGRQATRAASSPAGTWSPGRLRAATSR